MSNLTSSSLAALVLLGFTGVVLFSAYSLGRNAGENSIQLKWDTEKAATDKKISKIKEENHLKEQAYLVTITGLKDEILSSKKLHEENLNSIQSDYAVRLQQSNTRASIYQRQAAAGATECRSLAHHAARLDSSLEEGRTVVRELSEVIRLREREITILSGQMTADRNLFKF